MEACKVIVLLSTYNGEQYLQEQLESIYNQTYSNIEILVRDDASKDNTRSILKVAEEENKIKLITDKNLGFVNSFFELLKQAPLADYYAFADQDDIWEKDKIQRAVETLEKNKNENIPVMYYSNYDFYDRNMKFVSHPKKRSKTSFLNSLVECVNLGTTTLINHQVRQQILKNVPKENSLGHDWWIYMFCSAFGKVIYDDLPEVKHRIHRNNTSKCGESLFKKYKRRIKVLFGDNHFKKLDKQIQQFGECFYSQLTKDNKEIMDIFLKPKTLKKQIQKLFYPKKIMNLWNEEIILRIGFLLWLI